MKQFFSKRTERAGRTMLASYVFAVVLALQPLLNVEVDFNNKEQRMRYVLRLLFAVVLAILGKYKAGTVRQSQKENNPDAEQKKVNL